MTASSGTSGLNPAQDGASAGTTAPPAPEDVAASEGVPRLASRIDGWEIVSFDDSTALANNASPTAPARWRSCGPRPASTTARFIGPEP